MREIENIVGIFHYYRPAVSDLSEPKYFLIYLLDDKGFLDLSEAKKIFAEKYNFNSSIQEIDQKIIGPFESLENVDQYAFSLCESLNAARISLISVEEYNALLEESQDAHTFHQSLIEKGNVIENIERKKTGFFKKLFR